MTPQNQSSNTEVQLASEIAELKSALAEFDVMEKMNPRPAIDEVTLNQALSIRPASLAIDALLKVIPHVPGPESCYNALQRDLNLIYAITGSIGAMHGLALIIDYEGQEYDAIIETLERYGARTTAAYLREGMIACGGKIPADEVKRVKLALKHDKAFYSIDRAYQPRLEDEAAECFIAWLQQNKELALAKLNQIEPERNA
ncbi:MAG: hypothetical protein V4710_07640 [Verrucomicrobiota bacterium]